MIQVKSQVVQVKLMVLTRDPRTVGTVCSYLQSWASFECSKNTENDDNENKNNSEQDLCKTPELLYY